MDSRRIPVFRNIAKIKSTPRIPVIPYFSKEQWETSIEKIGKGEPKPDLPALRFQVAPWSQEAMIVYPYSIAAGVPILECQFVVKTIEIGGNQFRIMLLQCGPPVRNNCILQYGDSYGRPIWSCNNAGCIGSCLIIMRVNFRDLKDGFIQCQCQ